MANEPMITICGNATADAEIKFLPLGVPTARWTVAVTPRVKQGDTWTDGETVFYRCSAWRQLAETAGESITRGMRLLVHGRLQVRTYEKDGQTRTSLDIDVEHVGAEMRHATVTARKAARGNDAPRGGQPAADPWGSPSQAAEDIPPPF